MRTGVLVVQHGEKAREPGDPGLTSAGWLQARRTATWIASRFEVGAVWASPLRRAVETAVPLAVAHGLEVRTDPRLRERMNWQGAPYQALDEFLAEWQKATIDRSYVPAGGDSSEQAASRFIEAINEMADGAPPSVTVAVVAHGGVTVDALRTISGDEHLEARQPHLIADGVPCGAVTVLEREADTWWVRQLPSTDHLDEAVEHRPA